VTSFDFLSLKIMYMYLQKVIIKKTCSGRSSDILPNFNQQRFF
jgi:hypothetical protein